MELSLIKKLKRKLSHFRLIREPMSDEKRHEENRFSKITAQPGGISGFRKKKMSQNSCQQTLSERYFYIEMYL